MNEDTASTRAETLSITEAAQRLGVTVRTVQRRLDAGTLEAAFEGDTRRVMLRDTTRHRDATEGDTQRDSDATQGDINATFESESTRHRDATGRHAGATQRDIEGDTTRQGDSETARVLAESEAAFLRDALEVSRANETFLRGLIEQRDRDAAELRSALREALRAMPKQLEAREYSQPEIAQNSAGATKSAATGKGSGAVKVAAPRALDREPRPLWKVILGIR